MIVDGTLFCLPTLFSLPTLPRTAAGLHCTLLPGHAATGGQQSSSGGES
jgi:hypothetical protein